MEKVFKVTDEAGIHARPATTLVNTATKYSSDIQLEHEGKQVNLKSIMGVLSLGVQTGSEIKIIVDGDDAAQALEDIEQVIKSTGLGN